MASNTSQETKTRLGVVLRHYTRGFLLLLVIVLLGRLLSAIWPTEAAETLWTWLSAGADRWVLAAAGVLLVPFLLGWTATRWMHPILMGRRELRALLTFESGLVTELEPGDSRAAAVVLVDFPSADAGTIGVLTSVFPHPGTGAPLAAVFLPKGTDLLKGDIRIVPRDKVHLTDWKLAEYLSFQMSLGGPGA